MPEPGFDVQDFLDQNVVFPDSAQKRGKQGRVFASFHVEKDGKISNIKVERGFGFGSEEEAKKVLKMMPPWKPGRQAGKPVVVRMSLPINFRYPDDNAVEDVVSEQLGNASRKRYALAYKLDEVLERNYFQRKYTGFDTHNPLMLDVKVPPKAVAVLLPNEAYRVSSSRMTNLVNPIEPNPVPGVRRFNLEKGLTGYALVLVIDPKKPASTDRYSLVPFRAEQKTLAPGKLLPFNAAALDAIDKALRELVDPSVLDTTKWKADRQALAAAKRKKALDGVFKNLHYRMGNYQKKVDSSLAFIKVTGVPRLEPTVVVPATFSILNRQTTRHPWSPKDTVLHTAPTGAKAYVVYLRQVASTASTLGTDSFAVQEITAGAAAMAPPATLHLLTQPALDRLKAILASQTPPYTDAVRQAEIANILASQGFDQRAMPTVDVVDFARENLKGVRTSMPEPVSVTINASVGLDGRLDWSQSGAEESDVAKEVARVVRLLPNWRPAMKGGQPVRDNVSFDILIMPKNKLKPRPAPYPPQLLAKRLAFDYSLRHGLAYERITDSLHLHEYRSRWETRYYHYLASHPIQVEGPEPFWGMIILPKSHAYLRYTPETLVPDGQAGFLLLVQEGTSADRYCLLPFKAGTGTVKPGPYLPLDKAACQAILKQVRAGAK